MTGLALPVTGATLAGCLIVPYIDCRCILPRLATRNSGSLGPLWSFERLELYAGKLARTVLRRAPPGNRGGLTRHTILMDLVKEHIQDPYILQLIHESCQRLVDKA